MHFSDFFANLQIRAARERFGVGKSWVVTFTAESKQRQGETNHERGTEGRGAMTK